MRIILFILVIGILIAGCTGYQYVSSPHYIPLNEKKGEIKGNLAINNYSIGYSVSNHISIFSQGYYRQKITSINLRSAFGKENSGVEFRDEHSYEINLGASYFTKQSNIFYEVLVGSGFGHIKYEYGIDLVRNYEFSMDGNKLNLFIQPNIGYKYQDLLDLSAFSRFNFYEYYNLKTVTITGDNLIIEPEDIYFSGKTSAGLFLIEPGISVKVGIPEAKANFVLSGVINLTDKNMRYRELNFRVNVFLDFNIVNIKKQ